MKYLKNKRLYLILFILALSFAGSAQNSAEIGISLSKGVNDATSLNQLGIGGTITGKHQISKNGQLRLSIGYDWFGVQTKDGKSQAYRDSIALFGVHRSVVFLRGGFQQFLTDRVFVFVEGGVSDITLGSSQLHFGTNIAISYGAGLGYQFRMNERNSIIGSLAFNGNHSRKVYPGYDLNYVTFHIGYEFSSKAVHR